MDSSGFGGKTTTRGKPKADRTNVCMCRHRSRTILGLLYNDIIVTITRRSSGLYVAGVRCCHAGRTGTILRRAKVAN
jgi:hypothetical protein